MSADSADQQATRKRRRRLPSDKAQDASATEGADGTISEAVGDHAPANPARKRKSRAKSADKPAGDTASAETEDDKAPAKRKRTQSADEVGKAGEADAVARPRKKRKPKALDKEADTGTANSSPAPDDVETASAPAPAANDDTADSGPKRKGWWQRTFGD